jgi:hypothetical protein
LLTLLVVVCCLVIDFAQIDIDRVFNALARNNIDSELSALEIVNTVAVVLQKHFDLLRSVKIAFLIREGEVLF